MNISQANSTHQSSPPSDSSKLDTDSVNLHQFEDQLTTAQMDTEWFTRNDAETEKERVYNEQLERNRRDEELQDEVVAMGASQTLQDRIRLDGEREKTVSHKAGVDNKIIEEKVDIRKAHLRTPTVQENKPSESAETEFSELLLKGGKEKPQVATAAEIGSLKTGDEATGLDQPKKSPLFRPGDNFGNTAQQRFDAAMVKGAENQTNGQAGRDNGQKQFSSQNRSQSSENQLSVKSPGRNLSSKGFSLNEVSQSSTMEGPKTEAEIPMKNLDSKNVEQANTREIVENVKIMMSSRKNEMIMKLVPEHLGKLEIRLKKTGDKMTGRFKVETSKAKDLLESQLPQLRQGLEEQGILIEEFSILVNEDSSSMPSFSFDDQQTRQQNPSQVGTDSTLSAERIDPAGAPRARSTGKTDSGVSIYA
ncbi:MAG: hypothetical protein GY866_25320 [Proteobacteria bacterium]|nr:hypothetical protein [Pseudomonadota bacterium]